MNINPDYIRAEAHAYGMECKQADRAVSLTAFSKRLGMSPQWLSSGRSHRADEVRETVIKEWATLDVAAHSILLAEMDRVKGGSLFGCEWEIPESEWPHYQELTRILAVGQRREMFEDLRNQYGRAVAMRYAHVCDHPPAKGGRQGENTFGVAVSA